MISIYDMMKEVKPDIQLPAMGSDFSGATESPRAVELLKWFGKDGFTTLKDSAIETMEVYERDI